MGLSEVVVPGLTATAAADSYAPLAALAATPLTVGQSTLSRRDATSTTITMTSQALRLTYFQAVKSQTVTSFRFASGGTAAGVPTLIRFGLYSVAANGDLTLIGSTPNDTSLLNGVSTAYTKNLSTPVAITRGTVYAFGGLVVAATPPTMRGLVLPSPASEGSIDPRQSGQLTGQADLPASVAVGSLADGLNLLYAALI